MQRIIYCARHNRSRRLWHYLWLKKTRPNYCNPNLIHVKDVFEVDYHIIDAAHAQLLKIFLHSKWHLANSLVGVSCCASYNVSLFQNMLLLVMSVLLHQMDDAGLVHAQRILNWKMSIIMACVYIEKNDNGSSTPEIINPCLLRLLFILTKEW